MPDPTSPTIKCAEFVVGHCCLVVVSDASSKATQDYLQAVEEARATSCDLRCPAECQAPGEVGVCEGKGAGAGQCSAS